MSRELEQRRVVIDPAAFGKVAVLYGGHSSERQVSLWSGEGVLKALRQRGVNAYGIDVDDRGQLLAMLSEGGFERAFIALHGRGGEDGTLQGALECIGIPYTGSQVLASALGMDKLLTKQIWQAQGLPTLPYCLLNEEADLARAIERLGLPMAIKPAAEGSSVGVSRVDTAEQLRPAWEHARQHGALVLAEPWQTGGEYTAAVLQGQALPLIRMETEQAFYDYEAKYLRDDTRYLCPCGLAAEQEAQLQALVLKAFAAVGAHGWGRVDLVLDQQGQPWLLEINTVPGMTGHSLVPMAAAAVGIDYPELCWRILETSFAQRLG